MLREKVRRIWAFALALALTVGLVIHPALSATPASDMAAKSIMAAAVDDMPMPNDCDGCDRDQQGMPAACAAYCNSVVALPALAVALSLITIEILHPLVEPIAVGHVSSPDPYPPRTTSMS